MIEAPQTAGDFTFPPMQPTRWRDLPSMAGMIERFFVHPHPAVNPEAKRVFYLRARLRPGGSVYGQRIRTFLEEWHHDHGWQRMALDGHRFLLQAQKAEATLTEEGHTVMVIQGPAVPWTDIPQTRRLGRQLEL